MFLMILGILLLVATVTIVIMVIIRSTIHKKEIKIKSKIMDDLTDEYQPVIDFLQRQIDQNNIDYYTYFIDEVTYKKNQLDIYKRIQDLKIQIMKKTDAIYQMQLQGV